MQINWSQHYLRHDNPGGKTYYIVRRRDPFVGLFSNYLVFAGHIRYALANGWLPVIDMQHYPNAYLEPQLIGKVNAWEYYFRQPFDITLEEAYNSANIIASFGDSQLGFPSTTDVNIFDSNNHEMLEWRMLVKLGMFRIQPKIYDDIMSERNKLFSKNDRVLGVKLRGTDYVATRPYGHPIQPPVEAAIPAIDNAMKHWNCNKIFLATEDRKIFDACKAAFGDVLVSSDMVFVEYGGSGAINQYDAMRENTRYLKGKEYLTQLVILSKCNCFLASMSSGTTGVMMMTDGFERLAVFNLGKYGITPTSHS